MSDYADRLAATIVQNAYLEEAAETAEATLEKVFAARDDQTPADLLDLMTQCVRKGYELGFAQEVLL